MQGKTTENRPGSAIVSGFSFALLMGLALLSLLIVVMGARVYRSINDAAARNYQSRTVLSYIAGRVRASDAAGGVSVAEGENGGMLVLTETISGQRYASYIYYDAGGVCECFARAEQAFDPALGDRIVGVADFAVSRSGRVLTVRVTDSAGEESVLSLFLQSAEKEA